MEVLLLSTFKSGWTNTSKAKNNIFAEKFNSGLSKIMLFFVILAHSCWRVQEKELL